MYIEGDAGQNKMYGRFVFMKLLTKEKEIDLPSPLGEKVFFHQLEVSNYCFTLVKKTFNSGMGKVIV